LRSAYETNTNHCKSSLPDINRVRNERRRWLRGRASTATIENVAFSIVRRSSA
jgi:hypothetical protein